MFFRSSRVPTVVMPLCVRSAGHYLSGPDYPQERTPPRPFLQIYWTLEGAGKFVVDGRSRNCGPGDVFIFHKGEPHVLAPHASWWRYRWITFDGPNPEGILPSFGKSGRCWKAGRCPEADFESLQVALKNPAMEGELAASSIAYRILLAASVGEGSSMTGDSRRDLAGRCKRAFDDHYRNPGFGLQEVAEQLGVHRATVFRHFRSEFGLAPAVYLRNLRLQHALEALQESTCPIAALARDAGFEDPNYFARTVRKVTGLSPRDLRRGAPRMG